jgi:hypothetical protein
LGVGPHSNQVQPDQLSMPFKKVPGFLKQEKWFWKEKKSIITTF